MLENRSGAFFFRSFSSVRLLKLLAFCFGISRNTPNFGGIDFFGFLADWLNDALAGKFGTGHKKEILVPEHGDGGPYVNQMKGGFALPERIGITDGSHPDQTGPEG